MNDWSPASKSEVEALLAAEIASLSMCHRARLEAARVTPRAVPVRDSPGETVFVVAELQGKIVYWSDVEDGWEIAEPNEDGGIESRGCNQFELSHVTHQLFGGLSQEESS